MMVIFVSQCEKNALKKTRRVLDAFADRIGDNTWQTVITEEGLNAVKKLLRKTASKSTAVSCHWIRSRSRSQFLWVVGNRRKFNDEGYVAVNHTTAGIKVYEDSYLWKTLDVIKYAASIAGLFHDFGKANVLFQDKLKPKRDRKYSKAHEPYRHEWVSLRLFQAFVGDKKTDKEWLEALAEVDKQQSSQCFRDGESMDGVVEDNHPMMNLPPFAQLVAWLVVSHHRLPLVPTWKEECSRAPFTVKKNGQQEIFVDQWMSDGFDAIWNSHNCKDKELEQYIGLNWTYEGAGLPYKSMQWRSKACFLASNVLAKTHHFPDTDWLKGEVFTAHISRMGLMMADHYWSSDNRAKKDEWRNTNYSVYANTNRKTKQRKQQLDEHLIGVAHHAQKIIKALPKLNQSMRQLDTCDFLSAKTPKEYLVKFGWQDKSKDVAQKLSSISQKQGFFGINMASTGKGKTLANAKIMYALGKDGGRRRFSVALGLRTLTLQTGKEYRDKLALTDEQLAIAVGGVAVKQLFESEQKKLDLQETNEPDIGSESSDDYLDKDLYVDYQGDTYQHSLSEWTAENPRLEGLIQAPVLVCTIDHLIPATEGTKGGKQIAPMLRLLTSDLVIDEPDDFGLDDLPALCRLVHWAGMLGSRVLLSTATMPPALTYATFQAYQQGWAEFAKANLDQWCGSISCAWFDEASALPKEISDFSAYRKEHEKFVGNRIKHLKHNLKPKHKGDILPIHVEEGETSYQAMASVIHGGVTRLHQAHCQIVSDKKVSIGLVRMANIDPLVAVAKALVKMDSPENTQIHLCVYHSRFPLGIRHYLESKLDHILKRNPKKGTWPPEDFTSYLAAQSGDHHIFIVLASPVAEVGRDHDYDWAIIEPSSMRSIIQIAGRVLRHRDITPKTPNILLLDKNIKALSDKEVCFDRPGFEKKERALSDHDLFSVLQKEQYRLINAIERVAEPDGYKKEASKNLVSLEHHELLQTLFKDQKSPSKVWWKNSPHWCGEVQRQQKFRNSRKDVAIYRLLKDENDEGRWQWKNENVYPPVMGETEAAGVRIDPDTIELKHRNNFWFNLTPQNVYSSLASDLGMTITEVSDRFGEVRIVEYDNSDVTQYFYQENLGLYQTVG